MITFGTVSGGAGAALTGGNFWEGAATGFVVSTLNHAMHNKNPKRAYKRYFRQARERVSTQYGGGRNFSLSKTALGAGGLLYGVGQNIAVNGGQWLGKNGKYNSTSWGGNRWTGSRAGAFNASGAYKIAGRATFFLGAGISFMEGYGHLTQGNYLAASKSGLDITMGYLSTLGIPGLIIGSSYFLMDATMSMYTNRLYSNPAFLRSEYGKATSADPRFGGVKW